MVVDAPTHRLVTERRFRAMGTEVHLLATGEASGMAVDRAVIHLAQLEARWSRFRPESDLARLNAAAGREVVVAPETIELVQLAVAGWELTAGRFDPTLLRALEQIGYDRSFEWVGGTNRPLPAVRTSRGCGGIVVDSDRRTVCLPPDVALDAGAIGKGLAADLVTRRMMEQGARGAMTNCGGDLRVRGEPPAGEGWRIRVREPAHSVAPITEVTLADGGLATSTTLRRRWRASEGERHHVLDPTTGHSRPGGPVLATVIAGEGWLAEVNATAALVADAPRSAHTCPTLTIGADGAIDRLAQFERYES